jgi:putative membrane protein
MILTERSWFRSLISLRGTSLQRIWLRLGVTVIVAIFVTVLHENYGKFTQTLTTLPFTLIGIALGIFLGFRNNTSYDRFWEGRKLWGRLVNTSRSLTRQILVFIGPSAGEAATDADDLRRLHRDLVYRVIAYVHSLRHHLRDSEPFGDLEPLLGADETDSLRNEHNRPIAVLQALADRFRQAWRDGRLHALHLAELERSLTDLTDIQGGCERIKSTPIPASYTILIHRIVAVYSMTLPFGIVDSVGSATPVVVVLIGYAFYGLDAIGDEIENPFGTDPNDLPLSTLSRMLEVNLRQRLGESELPPLLQPQNGILS